MSAPTLSATISQPASQTIKGAHSNRVAIILCFFAIYVIWGSTYLAIRYAVETIPPLYAAGIRHLTSGSILLLWCVVKKLKPAAAQIRTSVVIGILFFLVGHGSLHWAEQRVPSGLASLLIATEPIMVFFLASFAAKRWQFNWMLLTGVFLGLAGVGMLVWRTILTQGSGMLVSSVMVLVGAFSWSAGIVYSRRSNLSGHPLLLSASHRFPAPSCYWLPQPLLESGADFPCDR
jgi:drug/metabolite transporter (DMT)-like permease